MNIISGVCAAQDTIESDTKETMPPDWILPTESFTFEVFQHKMDLAWQRHDSGVKHCTSKAYLLLPLFLKFTTVSKAVCELMAVISFRNGPCTSLQPVFHSGCLTVMWCFALHCVPLQSHDYQSYSTVCYISKLINNVTDSWSPSAATVFLEFWKRRRAELTYDWDLIDWEEEEVRQQYPQIDPISFDHLTILLVTPLTWYKKDELLLHRADTPTIQ